MNYSRNSCQWRIYIFCIPISPHWTWNLLRLISLHRNLKPGCSLIHSNHSNCIYGLCATMRTNKLLGRNCYYQLIFCNSIHRKNISRVNMRRFCSRQCYTKSILCNSLYPPIHPSSRSNLTPTISSPNRLKQPYWITVQ